MSCEMSRRIERMVSPSKVIVTLWSRSYRDPWSMYLYFNQSLVFRWSREKQHVGVSEHPK